MTTKLCDKCGKPASHVAWRWWKKPEEEWLCCKCYVAEGNPPADWHEGCMAAKLETDHMTTNDENTDPEHINWSPATLAELERQMLINRKDIELLRVQIRALKIMIKNLPHDNSVIRDEL